VDIKYMPMGTAAEVKWLVADQLGTPRMVVDKTGALSGVTRLDYLPFGEEITADASWRTTARGYVGDNVRQKFTSYERDAETGLDYAQARYFANAQGRFTGVDPLLASGHAAAPQTWNRYSYALNNPLRMTDPSGMSSNDIDQGQAQNIPQLPRPITMPDVTPIDVSSVQMPQYATPVSTASGPVVTDPDSPTIMDGTPEQRAALRAGSDEANRRLDNATCADFFGGASTARLAMGAMRIHVDQSMDRSGHPQGQFHLDSFVLDVNPYGSSFVTGTGSTYTFYLFAGSNRGFYKITLSGAEASAFAQLHETAHGTRSFGATDEDPFVLPTLWLNNYANNWKIWNACFGEVKATRVYVVPMPDMQTITIK